MAAFFLLVLAVGGGVVVADLLRENTAVGEITVFHHTVTGHPEGWLLAMAAGLGFAVALLLVASLSSTKARARRRRLRRPRRGMAGQVVGPKPDHDRLLDEFFGPDEAPRHRGRPARPAPVKGDRREGQARHLKSWDAPERVRDHPEPPYRQPRPAPRLHDDSGLPYPVRDGRRW